MESVFDTNLTVRGTAAEVKLIFEVLESYEPEAYEESGHEVFFEVMDIQNVKGQHGNYGMKIEEIEEFIKDSSEITLSLIGPQGDNRFENVFIFQDLADAAPGAFISGEIDGWTTYYSWSMSATLEDGQLSIFASGDVDGDAGDDQTYTETYIPGSRDINSTGVNKTLAEVFLKTGLDLLFSKDSSDENDNSGIAYLEQAAELGSVQAQYMFGLLLANGEKTPQNILSGLDWLIRAEEGGSKESADSLKKIEIKSIFFAAIKELNRKDTSPDQEKAFHIIQYAAKNGLPDAQFVLGKAYSIGRGLAQDYEQCINWLKKAAEQGNEMAQKELQKYQSPSGVYESAFYGLITNKKYNRKESAKPFDTMKKAAEAGSAAAYNALGVFYADPEKASADFEITVKKDAKKAKMYFKKALSLQPGMQQAENNLKKLEAMETSNELSKDSSKIKWLLVVPGK